MFLRISSRLGRELLDKDPLFGSCVLEIKAAQSQVVDVGLNYLRGDQVRVRSRGFLKKRQELIVRVGSEEWVFS